MKRIGIIPARMAASRFPGKPLAMICGRPMIEHVYRRSALCALLDEVVVATPDEAIAAAVLRFGGRAVMTSPSHTRAVDRVAEAAQQTGGDIIAIIQGDEPMLAPEMIEAAVRPVMDDADLFCTNLIARIASEEEFLNPNTIKVVMNERSDALYFSREPIPTRARIGFARLPAYKQVCLFGFRRDRLMQFAQLKPSLMEEAESIDMLRALDRGHTIRLVPVERRTFAVDTPEDIAIVERAMADDALCARYAA